MNNHSFSLLSDPALFQRVMELRRYLFRAHKTLKHSPPHWVGCVLSFSGQIRAHVFRVMRPASGARWDKAPARCRWQKKGRCLIRSGRKTGGSAKARTVFRAPQGGAKR